MIRGFRSKFRRIWIIFAIKRNHLSIMKAKRVLRILLMTLMYLFSLEMAGMEEIHLLRVKYSILVGKVRRAHNKPTTSFTIKQSNLCQGTAFRTFHVWINSGIQTQPEIQINKITKSKITFNNHSSVIQESSFRLKLLQVNFQLHVLENLLNMFHLLILQTSKTCTITFKIRK